MFDKLYNNKEELCNLIQTFDRKLMENSRNTATRLKKFSSSSRRKKKLKDRKINSSSLSLLNVINFRPNAEMKISQKLSEFSLSIFLLLHANPYNMIYTIEEYWAKNIKIKSQKVCSSLKLGFSVPPPTNIIAIGVNFNQNFLISSSLSSSNPILWCPFKSAWYLIRA